MTATMRGSPGLGTVDLAPIGPVLKTVLIAHDGSSESGDALRAAIAMSTLQRSTLRVVYVETNPGTPLESAREFGIASRDLPGAIVDHLAGDPAHALVTYAMELPETTVVVSAERNAGSIRSLGPLAEAVLDAPLPRILLLPPDWLGGSWTPHRILLAYDGSPSAAAALSVTAELAQSSGASVTALHIAARSSDKSREPGTLGAPRYVDQLQHELPTWAQEFVERMFALDEAAAAMRFRLVVNGGQPGSQIAQVARDNHADLLILPWHGKWREQKGGAVEAVVRRAECPVLLICTTAAN